MTEFIEVRGKLVHRGAIAYIENADDGSLIVVFQGSSGTDKLYITIAAGDAPGFLAKLKI